MKISYQWLKDFLDLDIFGGDIEEIAKTLTRIGFNVEELEKHEEDYILDLEITTNRPDCLSHFGIARELGAQYRLELKGPDCSAFEQTVSEALPARVSIEDGNLCPRYAARVMTDVTVSESPDWLKSRLEALGHRPINNIVDVTNYVMVELGHPLHAFDYDQLQGNRIVVRRARPDETLLTLDGVERSLEPSMLAICDARDPVALAGVMGGEESEISDRSRTILLESAYFHPQSVRSTAKKLGLRTEASFRFERGADSQMPVKALNRACRLIQQIGAGRVAGPVIDEHPRPQEPTSLRLRSDRIRRVVGQSLEPTFIRDVLSRLGFEVSEKSRENWQVTVPSFRVDVAIEDDLVEEVIRHHGYDRIEGTYPCAPDAGRFLPTHEHDRIMTRTLEGFGFLEAFNYVFINPAREHVFNLTEEERTHVEITNPLTEEDTHLRVSLVPGLIESLRRNLNYENRDVRLFEFGKVFFSNNGKQGGDLIESPRLGLLATGSFYSPYWDAVEHEFNFFHLKGILEILLGNLGHESRLKRVSKVPFLHPGIAARIEVGGDSWGVFGRLHPRIEEEYKFLQPVFVAELSLGPVYARPLVPPQYSRLGKFPSVDRDLSFLIDKEVEYARIVQALKELNIPQLQDVRLIDLYQDPDLPEGKVSLTIRLTFAHSEMTLTQEQVKDYTEKAFSTLESTFSAEAR